MKGFERSVLFLGIALLCILPVLADIDIHAYPVGDSFSIATGPESLSLCQCESFVDSIVVSNTGQFSNKFTIAFASDLVTISESEFELLPGKTKTIYAFVQAPCNRLPTETASFLVSDLFGNEFAFEKSYAVEKCQNLEATLTVDTDEAVQPCSPVTYEVLVTNPGVFTETYDVVFGAGGFEDYFGTPYQTLIIPAGQSGVATTALELDCDQAGLFTIPFTITALQNDLMAELEHELEVLPAYNYDMELSSADVCAREVASYPVTITNNAAFENTYSLSLDGPEYLSLEQETIVIPAGESATVMVTGLTSDDDAGTSPVTVITLSDVGGIEKIMAVNATINDCYGVSINVDLQEDVLACSGYVEYPVIVRNTGTVEEDLVLEIWGMIYGSFEEMEISLDPGEEELLVLAIDVPQNVSLHMLTTVRATVKDKGVVAEDQITFKFLDEESCHQPVLGEKRVRVRDDESSVQLTIMNAGAEETAYILDFVGADFFLVEPEDTLLIVAPGEQQTFTLLMYQDNSTVQERYDGIIQAFVKSADGEHVIIYESPLTIIVYHKSLVTRASEYFAGHPCQLVTLVLLVLIIIGGLIILARPDRNRRSHREVTVIVILLWLVAAIVLFSVYGLPKQLYEPVPVSEDPLTIVMAEDAVATLDVAQYFTDPDSDALSFTVSDIDNVSVTLENGTATFTPDVDWVGSRRFRVTAYDGEGGVTESPRMALQVVDVPEYTCWDVYVKYCGFLNLFLLAIVAFLVIILARVEDKRKPAEPPKATQKKVAPKKVAPKKVAPKKVAPKKVAPKKVAPKKVAPKKVAPKKASKKKAVKKAAPKKAAKKKQATKKMPKRSLKKRSK